MAETACLAHAFPYDSGIPNEPNQGNPLDALGESVSFGRFMTESLSWDKWSSFPQKRYVEEAERYSQPGSVAQKKAFFEAHYKRIAAMKAAALLEEANGSTNTADQEEGGICNNDTRDAHTMLLSSHVGIGEQQEVKIQNAKLNSVDHADGYDSNVKPVDLGNPVSDEPLNQLKNIEDQKKVSSITPQIEKPLVKKPVVSSLKSSIWEEAAKGPCSPAKPKVPAYPWKENIVTPTTKSSRIESTDKNRPSPKSLGTLLNFAPVREPNKLNTLAAQMIESSRVAPSSCPSSKDCATLLRTPTTASVSEVQKHPSATPFSETRRTETPITTSASGSKRTRPKWHILFAFFSKSLRACRKKIHSSMLSLRTGERAARRKQKLEEKKFNDNEALELQLQTKFKNVETEVRKLRKSLCFKARPLPAFYSERENSKN